MTPFMKLKQVHSLYLNTFHTHHSLKFFSLKIPKNTIPPTEQVDLADTDIFTPETIAVHKLDLISQDIMANYPSLLDNPISLMLNFTKSSQGVDNYEGFTRVAKPVYEMKMNENNRTSNNNSNSTVLSRLAMVLYVVRETFVLGNLNDKQMELLVEHSTKFFREKAIESVKDEGGWEVSSLKMHLVKCKSRYFNGFIFVNKTVIVYFLPVSFLFFGSNIR